MPMELTALLLSRLQFAFTISFHIIFPSFTIGLAAWLTVLEALHLGTGRPAYREVFEFWLKVFGVAFGLGVVSGIVMAFQFGTNWSVLSRMSGPIQGPLLLYETFTAFFLEASFFGILLFGRSRVPPWFYLFSTAMVALGTTFSAFWIMANNSWMQVPVGYVMENGAYVPVDWSKILFSPVLWVRFPHMLLASFLTDAFCVAATGAWYLLRAIFAAEAHIMLRMGLYLAAVMLLVAWVGSYLIHKGRIEQSRVLLWLTFLSFPLPFIAILTGWYTAEVGRQPWVVYGVLRTADAMTPFLTARTVAISLIVYCVVYTFIFAFGTYYIYRLLRAGPEGRLVAPPPAAVPNRPMSVVDEHHLASTARHVPAGE